MIEKVFTIIGIAFLLLSSSGRLRADGPGSSVPKRTFVYSVKGSDTLRLDKYDVPPGVTANGACLIFVFGGGFAAGSRDDGGYLSFYERLAGNGYAVVAIDYRLGMKNPKAKAGAAKGKIQRLKQIIGVMDSSIRMAVEDLFDATNFIIAHAGEWRIDPEKIVSCGSSAGAITVLQAEYEICSVGTLSASLPQGFNYAGVIAFAGAIFSTAGDLKWRNMPAPIQFFHGDADTEVPYGKIQFRKIGFYGSGHIAGQLKALNAPYYFYSVEGEGHRIAGSPMTQNWAEISAFLEKWVAGREELILETSVQPANKPAQKKKLTRKDFVRNFSRE